MNSNALPNKHSLNQRYIIKKMIGQGGFGITYLAFDSLLDQEVCIKELFVSGHSTRREDLTLVTTNIPGSSFKSLVASFVKEAKKLAKFRHPNIVRVTDVFHANETAYMVMDYIKGETLSQRIKKRGALSGEKSRDFFYMLLDAVETIHQKNILHRDIKPGNILVTKENILVLIDFGSAREFVDGRAITHTTMVSKGYAPNEQYISRALRGPFTDIYSLGATLYFILTGEVPMEAPARIGGELPSPHALNPKVSIQLSKVVMKAMEVRPEGRFQSVESFREALQELEYKGDTEIVNKEDVKQIETPSDNTEKIDEVNKGHTSFFLNAKRHYLVYVFVCILLLIVILSKSLGLVNSSFSFFKEKADSIPGKVPYIDSAKIEGDSSHIDPVDGVVGDGPKKGISQGGATTYGDQTGTVSPGYSVSQGTIQFGYQQWMIKNLEVTQFRNGDPIREVKSDEEWQQAAQNKIPAWCFFDNDPNKGKLYNWFAVNDSRGLAPKGWHVPSEQEWGRLFSFLGGTKQAAQQLKDDTGFDAKLSGFRNHNGKFEGRRLTGRWWTRTPFSGQDYAYGLRLKLANEILSEKFSVGHGFSVRVIKD